MSGDNLKKYALMIAQNISKTHELAIEARRFDIAKDQLAALAMLAQLKKIPRRLKRGTKATEVTRR